MKRLALLALAALALQALAAVQTMTALPAVFQKCADENGTCVVGGPMLMTFGAVDGFAVPIVVTKSMACNWAPFGGDPKPGVKKACYTAPTDSLPDGPTVQPPPLPLPTAVDTHGFYMPELLFAFQVPNAQYSFFAPQPPMCTDLPKFVAWSDPNTNDAYTQGTCSTVYGSFTWTRHRSIHPLVAAPTTWPSEEN